MTASQLRFLSVPLAAVALLAGCGQRLNLEINARIDGQPAAQAKVVVDREELGVTDAQGIFKKELDKKAGAEIELMVSKEMPGYRIEPWKTSFLVKLPKENQTDTYRFAANLEATRFVTLRVTSKGAALPETRVTVEGKDAGVTDAKGEIVYTYGHQPAKGVEIAVTRPGYAAYRARRALDPGEVIELALQRQTVVTVRALTDEYGHASGVQGLGVSVDGRTVGKTDAQGGYTYNYRGDPGRKAVIAVAAPGYIPGSWKTTVRLEGEVGLQHYFYPTALKPIRTGIYRVVGNTPGADLKDVAAQTEQALANQLFRIAAFREVPSARLQAEVAERKLSLDRIAAKGWRDTPLRSTVDMIVLGSIARDGDGYLIEAKFHSSSGKVVFSEIARARSARSIDGAVRDIVANVAERFPFEGTVIGAEDDRYRINLGKSWRVGRGAEFAVSSPAYDAKGKATGYRDIGRLEVKRGDDTSSLTEIVSLKEGSKIQPGDRVVRLTGQEEDADRRAVLQLTAKGGIGGEASPLAGANVYLNGEWKGTTAADGRAEIPVRPGRNYALMLYRHGYQQLTDKISIGKSGEAREFTLTANTALFKLDSEPSGATVTIDDEPAGKTPLAGKSVTLGFHSVRIAYGDDYRDFFQVMEFNKSEEDRTGERRVVLQKDFLRIGDRARQKGDIDGAIQAYAAAGRDHPDYAEAHRRLGTLYLDDKQDYDRAIAEFEAVLALPENAQLIHKQFAITFTNLGHAYYESGDRLANTDRDAASREFAKAIKVLQTAKQNTRFFPKDEYYAAVHDTYYYLALSYHKLYLITKQPAVMNSASLAWRDYFDFFPKRLESNPVFAQAREAARRYRDQIQEP
jgi:tetratricopeptide (TPR) repeat protein